MDQRLAELLKQNRALCESTARIPVSETLMVLVGEPKSIAESIAEAKKDGRNPKFKLAKVGHADKNNENNRIYPRKEWLVNVERINKVTGPNGTTLGAVDHQGCAEGGNLKTSPIIWRHMDVQDDGSVLGEFEIVKDHSAGKDLLALIEAGSKIGFSTFGYAQAHRPSQEEAQKYGIPYDSEVTDEEYDGPVVIDNWELVKIDAVDNPAVRDARLLSENKNGGATRLPEKKMKTLEDLKNQFPEVFALHEAAVKVASDEVEALKTRISSLEATDVKYRAIVKKLGDNLTCLAQEHGAQMPLKDGAEINKELEEAGAKLASELATAKGALDAAIAEKAELQAKLDAAEAAKVDAKRRADVTEKSVEALKDNKFAAVIKPLVDAKIADGAFDVEALLALVKTKTEEYEAVTKVTPAPKEESTPAPQPKGVTSFVAHADDLDEEDEKREGKGALECLIAE